jgi:hypothetical protein
MVKNPSHATVPLRNHFHRMTVSLGDHNVNNTHSETKNVFRKLKRIVRSDCSTELGLIIKDSAEILEQSMGAGNRVGGIGLSYRPGSLCRLAGQCTTTLFLVGS